MRRWLRSGGLRRWLFTNRGYRDLWLLAITGLVFWSIAQTYSISDQSRRSLCTLRGDLQQRVDSGVKFLSDHPHGAFGFSPKQIRESIANQQRTISALRGLDCP